MNILIVDDEHVIREGMNRTIQRSFPKMAIFLAATPEEAIEVLRQDQVDVVFTDVLMPGMTGLELMNVSKRRHPHTKWVVISAHSEFAYAKEALRLGARDYILKPIGKDNIIGLMMELQSELEREAALTSDQHLLKSNIKFLREAVFIRWASGLDIGRFDMSTIMEHHPHFHLVLVRLEYEGKRNLEHYIVDNVLTELIEQHGVGFTVNLDRKSVLGLLTLKPGAAINAFKEKLERYLSEYLKVPFDSCCTGLLSDRSMISEHLRALLRAPSGPLKETDHSGESAIDIAIQYIRANYQSELSLEKAASIVFLNPVYFSQLFKQKTGHGYKEYVIQLRLEKAKELLRDPSLKIAGIAESVGYQDVRHFTQVFRKRFTVTPSEYRTLIGV